MRLDHIAYRVRDRRQTVDFFLKAFNYRVQTEFDIQFDDGTTARCFALEPPEKLTVPDSPAFVGKELHIPWVNETMYGAMPENGWKGVVYHLAPEIFVSDGSPGSIVGDWVAHRGGIGGIHHLAYQVESVQATMQLWRDKGYAEFTTESPLTCPDLTQVFTKPSELTGVIYEFIERGRHGFCRDNVKDLMNSTKNVDQQQKIVDDFPDAAVAPV